MRYNHSMISSEELLEKYLVVVEKLAVLLERQNIDLGNSLRAAQQEIKNLKKAQDE